MCLAGEGGTHTRVRGSLESICTCKKPMTSTGKRLEEARPLSTPTFAWLSIFMAAPADIRTFLMNRGSACQGWSWRDIRGLLEGEDFGEKVSVTAG